MNSKNLSAAALRHLNRVKSLPCALCGNPPPSSAHHIRQGLHFTAVALCYDCHQGTGGWHGTKAQWRIRKKDELDALDQTIKMLAA